jgi:uncharacterized protein YaeQ
MSKGSTLYRFKLNLSDVDRSVYESLDFRLSRHASESVEYLLTRALAYALNYEEGLEFSQGLANPDEPSIRQVGEHGVIVKWIDIGNPAARRIHKASKSAKAVRVYTYKDPEILLREAAEETIHRSNEIEIFSIPSKYLESISRVLARENVWTILHNDGELLVQVGEESFSTPIGSHRLR